LLSIGRTSFTDMSVRHPFWFPPSMRCRQPMFIKHLLAILSDSPLFSWVDSSLMGFFGCYCPSLLVKLQCFDFCYWKWNPFSVWNCFAGSEFPTLSVRCFRWLSKVRSAFSTHWIWFWESRCDSCVFHLPVWVYWFASERQTWRRSTLMQHREADSMPNPIIICLP
jgi:hypothetical protein